MKAFERNLASSRQRFSSIGGHYAPETSNLQFEILKSPPYSSDLAPSGYYLLPNLKKHFKVRKFTSTEEVILDADGWFAAQPKMFLVWVKEVRTTK
jgi:hypothetical protein